MAESERHRPSRLAIGFVVVGLTLAAAGVWYIWWAGRERELPPFSRPAHPEADALHALLATLIVTLVLFLLFVIGSLVMVRAGRAFLVKPRSGPTRYVDAWGNYRLTDEQIAAAAQDLRSFGQPPPPPPSKPPGGDA